MSYEVNGKSYDKYSSKNQRILDKLVEREVYSNVTDMVEDLRRAEDCGIVFEDSWNDFENAVTYECPECDSKVESNATKCPECGAKFEWPNEEYGQPMQYFIVSDWFGDKLLEQKEMVMKRYMGDIWGRQTFGQAILLDSVVFKIAHEMGILEGQDHEWDVD